MNNLSLTLRHLIPLSYEKTGNWNPLASSNQKVIGVALAIIASLALICYFYLFNRKKENIQILKSTPPQNNSVFPSAKGQDEKSMPSKTIQTSKTQTEAMAPIVVKPPSENGAGISPLSKPAEIIKPPAEEEIVETIEKGAENISLATDEILPTIEEENCKIFQQENIISLSNTPEDSVTFQPLSPRLEISPSIVEKEKKIETSVKLEDLLDEWKSTLNEEEILKKIGEFFFEQKPTPQLFALCSKKGILVKRLVDSPHKELKTKLIGCYALWLLDSGDKAAPTKIISHIKRLEDEQYLFGAFLSEHCQTSHIPPLFKCFLEDEKRSSIMEGFLSNLLKSNANQNLLTAAFKSYWPLKKNFDQALPPCSSKILPLIQFEEALQIIYSAAPDDLREEVKEHFKSSYSHKGVNYKISLDQAIIDRVLE